MIYTKVWNIGFIFGYSQMKFWLWCCSLWHHKVQTDYCMHYIIFCRSVIVNMHILNISYAIKWKSSTQTQYFWKRNSHGQMKSNVILVFDWYIAVCFTKYVCVEHPTVKGDLAKINIRKRIQIKPFNFYRTTEKGWNSNQRSEATNTGSER